ncbi:MAG: hypothetical protein AAF721_40230 [Myxococcota bacterium]
MGRALRSWPWLWPCLTALACTPENQRASGSFSAGDGGTGAQTGTDTGGAAVTDGSAGAEWGPADSGSETAAPALCGDGEVQPPEACDGDLGCTDDCQWTELVEAFRVSSIDVLDPPLHSPGSCTNITNLANAALNTALNSDATTDPAAPGFGFLDLAPLMLFYPVRTAHETGHFGVATGRCTAEPIECTLEPDSAASNAVYANLGSGTCLESDPTELAEGAVVPPATAPCMVAPSTSITLDFRPFPLQLQALGIAGQFEGSPPERIVRGLLRGFVLETAACDMENQIAEGYPVVGGATIGQLLAGGPADCGGCTDLDHTDEGPNGERGWWFYAAFEAERVPFDDGM